MSQNPFTPTWDHIGCFTESNINLEPSNDRSTVPSSCVCSQPPWPSYKRVQPCVITGNTSFEDPLSRISLSRYDVRRFLHDAGVGGRVQSLHEHFSNRPRLMAFGMTYGSLEFSIVIGFGRRLRVVVFCRRILFYVKLRQRNLARELMRLKAARQSGEEVGGQVQGSPCPYSKG